MNWAYWRRTPWIDTRARFVASVPRHGALLDLGSSDGQTLRHFAELRPDIAFHSSDLAGSPADYPHGTEFQRADFETDPLPWPDARFDAITCMHVVEHLHDPSHLIKEAARLLRPGGRLYVETPNPKSVRTDSAFGGGAGTVTMNFFDDPTHVQPVPVESLARMARDAGLTPGPSGASRNWLFVAAYPFLAATGATTRKRFVAQLHWMGWSAYLIAAR